MRDLKPLFSRLVLKPDAEPEEIGGILLADAAKAKMRPQTGQVLTVGPDCEHIAPGDRVIFSRYEGHELEFEGERVRICDEKDIYCVVPSA